MINYIDSYNDFSLLESYLAIPGDMPYSYSEIPTNQDPLTLVAQQSINPLVNTMENPDADIDLRPNPFVNRPIGRKFTLQEDLDIFYGRAEGKKFKEIANKMQNKTEKQVKHRLENLFKHDPSLRTKLDNAIQEQASIPKIDTNPSSKERKQRKRNLRELQLVLSTSNSLERVTIRRNDQTRFTDYEDQLIIGGKIRNFAAKRIADMTLDKSAVDIRNRWSLLKKDNPQLQYIVEKATQENALLLGLEPVKPPCEDNPLSFLPPNSEAVPLVDSELRTKLEILKEQQANLLQMDPNPLQKTAESHKRKVNVLDEAIQPSKKLKQPQRNLREFRLVFTTPISLENDIIIRGKRPKFTEKEDTFIINGKIDNLRAKKIANGILNKTEDDINYRWTCLKKLNPNLLNIVQIAKREDARLIGLEPLKTACELDPLPFLASNPETVQFLEDELTPPFPFLCGQFLDDHIDPSLFLAPFD